MPLCSTLTAEYDALLAKKREFDTLLEKNDPAADLTALLTLKAELMEGKRTLEDQPFVSLETAESILDKENVLAAEDIENTYGFRPELPRIPFKRKELELWKELNEENETLPPEERIHFRLVFDIDKTNEERPLDIETLARLAGNNIITNPDGSTSHRLYKDQFDDDGTVKNGVWFKDDPKVTSATPSGNWKITSDEILPGSAGEIGKSYLKQTDFLIGFWRTKVFPRNILSEEEKAAYERIFAEWEKDKSEKNDAIALTSHPVSQALRESFSSTASRTILLQKSRNQKILKDKYNRSNTPSSDGSVVDFGVSVSSGAGVGRFRPEDGWANGGVVFSRSGVLKGERMRI